MYDSLCRVAVDPGRQAPCKEAAFSSSAFCQRCNGSLRAGTDGAIHCPRCLLGLALSPSNGATDPFPRLPHPYLANAVLGQGATAVVYRGEQTAPMRRPVAVKVLKVGMDSRAILARFAAERQTLALMEHPSIATILDAGETERGRPFFVMELVHGPPITTYCDDERLGLESRLALLIQVCLAVQHAHRKGIVHRDLKPSNILVATVDDGPLPKIIDFGIAKATEAALFDSTRLTRLGEIIGTPQYMSPEQALGGPDIDTQTDVYSLGVLAYELLTGTLPVEPSGAEAVGPKAVRKAILEHEPERPSARLSLTDRDLLTEAAARRSTDCSNLRRALRGDLDWIVMKALEKDRSRRYESPQHLASDLQRYLDNKPVLAGPPSVVSRVRKFARRHRIGVGLAFAGFVLVATFAGMIVQESRSAVREAEALRWNFDFLVGLFEVTNPESVPSEKVTVRELLDRGREHIETDLKVQPEVRARLLMTLGNLYAKLGFCGDAEPLIAEALEIRRRLLGNRHPDTLQSISDMGTVLQAQGDLDVAEPLYREALEGKRRKHGADDPRTLEAIDQLGSLFWARGDLEDALARYRTAFEGRRRSLSKDHPDTLITMNNLGFLLLVRGELAEAEIYLRDALARRQRVLGDEHPHTLQSTNNMGLLLHARSDVAAAESYLRAAFEGRRRVLGPEHPSTVISMGNLGDLYTSLGRLAEAELLLADAVAHSRSSLKAGHVISGVSLRKHGRCLVDRRRYPEAEAALLEARRILVAAVGEGHYQVERADDDLCELYVAWGRRDEATSCRSSRPPL